MQTPKPSKTIGVNHEQKTIFTLKRRMTTFIGTVMAIAMAEADIEPIEGLLEIHSHVAFTNAKYTVMDD
jgi:hypothetical protein